MPIIDSLGNLFNVFLLQPLLNLLIVVVVFFESIHLPGALGFSIILLTLGIRFILWPLTAQQTKSMKKMNELKPKLDELKKKHGEDKTAFAQAQMQLFKEHNYNPAGGCLYVIVQILLIAPLYQVFGAFLDPEKGLSTINHFIYSKDFALNTLPDPHFFGLNLLNKPSDFQNAGVGLILVPVITGVLTFVQSKMMSPLPVKKYPSDSSKEKKEKDNAEDAQQAVQTQMTFMMPIIIGYASFNFPIGLALYWNAITVISIWQQYLISGWGGFGEIIKKIKK